MAQDASNGRLPTFLIALLALTALASGCISDGDGTDGAGGDDAGGDDGPDPNYGMTETWYLHETGPCDNTADQVYFMDKTDSSDDVDGCGVVGYSVGGSGFTFTYPGTLPSHGHDSGAAVAVDLYLQFTEPGPVSIDWVLRGDGSELASGTMEAISASQTAWTHFSAETTTSAAAASGTNLTFEYTYPTTAGSNFHGYEGDHTSMFVIG